MNPKPNRIEPLTDRLRFAILNHQGKANLLHAALVAQGHEPAGVADADVLLIDTDWPSPTGAGRADAIEACIANGGIVIVYPHGAGPSYDYDGKIQPDMRVTAHLAQGPGEIAVYTSFNFPLPVYDVGWFYCAVEPFRPTDRPERVLFAPRHPTGDGQATHEAKDANRSVFEQLLALGCDVTVQMFGSLEMNGLWQAPGVQFVPSNLMLTHEHVDEADAVIADGTLGFVAVARGKPVVMMGQYGIAARSPKTITTANTWLDRLTLAQFQHWDKYAALLRYPYDTADGELGTVLLAACRGGQQLDRWRSLFIGDQLRPSELSSLLLRLYRARRDRSRVDGPRQCWLPPKKPQRAAATARTSPLHAGHTIIMGPIYGAGAYGSAVRGLTSAFRSANEILRLEETAWSTWDAGLAGDNRLAIDSAFLVPVDPAHGHLRVWNFFPHYFRSDAKARQTIGRSGCETDRWPVAWLEGAARVDRLWVPNRFAMEHLVDCGLPASKLRILPPCVAMSTIAGAQPANLETQRTFQFLSMGEWVYRNGWDVLVRAFVREFRADEDVALVIKSHSMSAQLEQAANDIRNMIRREVGDRATPPIRLLWGIFPEAQIHVLLRSCHAYVQPSRGEAWGHAALEAMAAGLPVIASDWGAHQDIVNKMNGDLIECRIVDVPPEVCAQRPSYAGHRWAEPSVEHLQALLRTIRQDPIQAQAQGLAGMRWAATSFSASAVAPALRRLLDEVNAD